MDVEKILLDYLPTRSIYRNGKRWQARICGPDNVFYMMCRGNWVVIDRKGYRALQAFYDEAICFQNEAAIRDAEAKEQLTAKQAKLEEMHQEIIALKSELAKLQEYRTSVIAAANASI